MKARLKARLIYLTREGDKVNNSTCDDLTGGTVLMRSVAWLRRVLKSTGVVMKARLKA